MDKLTQDYMQQNIESLVLIGKLRDINEELYKALQLLLADVKQYEAWQRPCHAVDVAEAALAKVQP